jgi:hypothetical protein
VIVTHQNLKPSYVRLRNRISSLCRIFSLVFATWITITATAAVSEEQTDFDKDKNLAYAEFAKGQVQRSADLLKVLIKKAPTKEIAANLERDLVEVCATGYLACYSEANQALFSFLQSDKALSGLYPELMLYVVRESVWAGANTYVQQLIDKGGPSSFAPPSRFPATFAEMQLALHPFYVRTGNLKAAEEATSSAILGLLMSSPSQVYTTNKILVGLLDALVQELDIVGAFQLLDVIDPYVSKNLSHESVLYAQYLLDIATLFGYTNLNSRTEKAYADVSKAVERLDIHPDIRAYHLSAANSAGSAVLVADNKLDEAVNAKRSVRK